MQTLRPTIYISRDRDTNLYVIERNPVGADNVLSDQLDLNRDSTNPLVNENDRGNRTSAAGDRTAADVGTG
jgi:hypothetical protein